MKRNCSKRWQDKGESKGKEVVRNAVHPYRFHSATVYLRAYNDTVYLLCTCVYTFFRTLAFLNAVHRRIEIDLGEDSLSTRQRWYRVRAETAPTPTPTYLHIIYINNCSTAAALAGHFAYICSYACTVFATNGESIVHHIAILLSNRIIEKLYRLVCTV